MPKISQKLEYKLDRGHLLIDHGINPSHNDLHDSATAAADHDHHALVHIAELLLVLAVKGQDRGRYISEIQGLSEDVQGTLMQMIQRALADLQGANRQARMRKSVHLRHAATHLEEENAELKKKVKELEERVTNADAEKEQLQSAAQRLESALEFHKELMSGQGGGEGKECNITEGFHRNAKVSKLELGTWAERLEEVVSEMGDSQSFVTVKKKAAQITQWWDLSAKFMEQCSTPLAEPVLKILKATALENPSAWDGSSALRKRCSVGFRNARHEFCIFLHAI